jgi:Flp pilus assembly pilin Flp
MLHKWYWGAAAWLAGRSREPGQTNVEYALILFVLAGVTAIGFSVVGQHVQEAVGCVTATFAGRC